MTLQENSNTKVYDEICGRAYVNIYTLTKDADEIGICCFDPKNKEHLFVYHVAKGLGGVLGKPVAVEGSRYTVWKLNRNIKSKECKTKVLKNRSNENVVVPEQLLNFMRDFAKELCGDDFNFGMIYDAFYGKDK